MDTDTNYDAYVEKTYDILRKDCVGLDAVYEEFIVDCIGRYGLRALLECKLLETCGVVNGRQLYTLCCEGGS